jgi:CDGSH-type Zn-finger protein
LERLLSDKTIKVNKNGPLRVEGDVPLMDHEGNPISTPAGRPYHLCRCGGSGNKPFCDGTHNRIDFDGS